MGSYMQHALPVERWYNQVMLSKISMSHAPDATILVIVHLQMILVTASLKKEVVLMHLTEEGSAGVLKLKRVYLMMDHDLTSQYLQITAEVRVMISPRNS